jgi:hypothetical protein
VLALFRILVLCFFFISTVALSKNKMKMNCLLLVIMLGSSSSFHMTVPVSIRRPTVLHFYPKEFERAIQCAEKYGVCDVDELLKLADGEYFPCINNNL